MNMAWRLQSVVRHRLAMQKYGTEQYQITNALAQEQPEEACSRGIILQRLMI
jgi:hypothetical protein